jgi:hypothetical protein
MKTNLVACRIFVRIPEEWPASLSEGDQADRITHNSLRLPGSVNEILVEMFDQLRIELKAIHPDIEIVVEK